MPLVNRVERRLEPPQVGVTNNIERAFLWAGGAAFVGSLALTAWTYATRLGAALPFQPWPALAHNSAMFGLFALHHSLFSRERIKGAVKALVPERLERSVYVWIAS